jgi:hypothetical protein
MQSRFSLTLTALLVLVICLDASAAFKAGIAVRIVTPDPLLPVCGGVGPSNPVTKKEGDLTVRAIVFEQGDAKVAIVSTDFLGFPGVLCNRARAGVKSIPPENILIGATHTHSAPDCYGFPDGKGGTSSDPKYIASVCAKITEAIEEANSNLKPARLKIASGEAHGKIAFNYYAEQLYDPRCNVIQALDESGTVFATLVNYAVHPEVIGSERGICSPDLVGPLYEEIAAKGGGIGIFMNSAQGGMVTADNRRENGKEARTYEECRRIGTLLADEALRIVKSAPEQASPKMVCKARSLVLPVESPLMKALIKQMPGGAGGTGDSVTTQFNLIDLGNAQILTIPGEALPNIGFYLKRKMHGEHNFLFGLTNDAFGYILTKEDFDSFKRYSYVSRTSLGEHTGEILVNEALKFIEASPRPEAVSASNKATQL